MSTYMIQRCIEGRMYTSEQRVWRFETAIERQLKKVSLLGGLFLLANSCSSFFDPRSYAYLKKNKNNLQIVYF